MKLQNFLEQNYPQKKEIKEIIFSLEIDEILEGGELDLSEFINLEKIEINPKILKTPITKLILKNLNNSIELIWNEIEKDTLEDKKLWTDLGIEELNEENKIKQNLIREVKRIAKLSKTPENETIKVYFTNSQEKLGDKTSLTEFQAESLNHDIYLQLERKDKQNNFCPSLVFWSLAQELTKINHENYDKDPNFWNNFDKELGWINGNLSENYRSEFELLLEPSSFPVVKLEIKNFHQIYYPNSENGENGWENFSTSLATIKPEIADKGWKIFTKKVIELINLELKNNPSEEEKEKLAIKLAVDYNFNGNEYIIQAQYHQQNPFKSELENLISTIPLKLEIENLKEEKDQLPTSENFEKLEKQIISIQKEKSYWENCLKDYVGDKKFDVLEEKLKNQN